LAIQIQELNNGKRVTISVEGRFEFSLNREFREAYKKHGEAGTEYEIDLSETEYMDSSALGMLLMIKEYAEEKGGTVILCRPTSYVLKLIELANFHKLFTINS
jgi:anti-anti-sigma factor